MAAGKLLSGRRSGESSGFWRPVLDLIEHFFQQVFRRHAMVFDADGHVGGDLVEGFGDLVQAGDPVVVVLDGGEAELGATSSG
jgi:hypothetical protein